MGTLKLTVGALKRLVVESGTQGMECTFWRLDSAITAALRWEPRTRHQVPQRQQEAISALIASAPGTPCGSCTTCTDIAADDPFGAVEAATRRRGRWDAIMG